ncbi:TauD/TfdA family dioxygenase [Xenophilus sp. Marseille-Q4582]|uniref:TauD/TfdA family dioxygenase n=1 Tax=Xenophilus sp. Marseille-Q4582 TaxID=2866600 RepID=UPI001CE46258
MSQLDPIRWKIYPRTDGRLRVRAREIIESLRPDRVVLERLWGRSSSAARENTLSYFHGHEEFPLHSDRALTHTPPRWLLLVAPRPRTTQTRLFDTENLKTIFGENYLRRALFVQIARNGHYSRLLVDISNQQCIRYNPDVMRAVNAEASAIDEYLRSPKCNTITIDWRANYMTLVDNWAMLHARSAFTDNDDVSLFRFSVWSKINDLDIS